MLVIHELKKTKINACSVKQLIPFLQTRTWKKKKKAGKDRIKGNHHYRTVLGMDETRLGGAGVGMVTKNIK